MRAFEPLRDYSRPCRRARELLQDGLTDFFRAMALITFDGGPKAMREAQKRLYASAWTPSDTALDGVASSSA